MNKLIELLNESAVFDTIFENEYQVKFRATKIISKDYGFIKWLVENDKIDRKKVYSFCDTTDKPYEDILCLLALSDTPIEDLIEFLK